jgi:class 3 adenylate cyclase
MGDAGEERRLTTILAADVVGYSGLMAADESATLAHLKAHRKEVIEPKVAEYRGRIVKLMGDGILMEFASVVDALRFAVEVQRAVAERNTEVPEERRIAYRMGINIGDIIVEGDDIYGDGVNVAARLEALAEPGGICVARNVHSQVEGKVDLAFEDLGEQVIKNIPKPVRVFRVLLDETETKTAPKPATGSRQRLPAIAAGLALSLLAVAGLVWWASRAPEIEPASVEAMAFPLPDKPSIAVLPFNNMSEDASQEYFADGMTEDLITDLSKISGLFVIARNSSFSYKGQQVQVRQVAEELGVRYVLEGSVRRAAATSGPSATTVHWPTCSTSRTRSPRASSRLWPCSSRHKRSGRSATSAPTMSQRTTPICWACPTTTAARPRTMRQPRRISRRPSNWTRSIPMLIRRSPRYTRRQQSAERCIARNWESAHSRVMQRFGDS